MDLMPFLGLMAQKQASDLFMSVGAPAATPTPAA